MINDMVQLTQLVRELRFLANRAHSLAKKNLAAERNLYAILQHIEILEAEICDPVEALYGEMLDGVE